MNSQKTAKAARTIADTALVWMMFLRVVVVTALMGSAVIAEVIRRPRGVSDPLYSLIALTYLLTLVYALAWPFTANYRKQLAYVQILGDLLIVTGIVYSTGGTDSNFSSVYFIVIIAASIILFRRGGFVAASAASVLYGSLIQGIYLGAIPPYAPGTTSPVVMPSQVVAYTIFLNVFGFYAVAFLTSYLSENLRLTGRKLEEASDFLADLQVFNQTIIDSITSGLMTTDFDGKINFFNGAASAIFARSPEEAVGKNVRELLAEEDDFLDRAKENLGDGRRFLRLEGTYLNARGDEIYLGMSLSYLLYEEETLSGFLFTFQDLTEIRRLEREVRLKENLATMGEMAAGMAHEIRNPLASISGSVQVLREADSLNAQQKRLMEIIVRESERLSGTLTEFLAYARPPRFEPGLIDLCPVVEETASLLEHSSEVLPEHEILVETPPEPLQVFADPNQMKQITWNLARNALQAMPHGGRLVMSLSRNRSGEIVMSFRDEGVGMTDGEVHKVFQPFSGSFERGSGIGLAIVYRIVKDYNGFIQVDTVASKGTEISVRFPMDRRTIG